MQLNMMDRIGHAEVAIGDAVVMLADEFPEMGAIGPTTLKGTSVTICLHVANVDKTYAKAVAAGAKSKMPPTDQFYGYRAASIVDPFGHEWMLQKEIETVTPREMQKRLDRMMAEQAAAAPAKKTAAPAKKKGK
jgi:PhnB protein